MDEIKQLIEIHDEAKKRLVRRQYANEITEKIKVKLAEVGLAEYTDSFINGYSAAVKDIISILDAEQGEDPERIAAAIQMGFIHERNKGANPYME